MSDISEIGRAMAAPIADRFSTARDKLTEFLVGYSLIESYFAFVRARRSYPFMKREAVVPGSAVPRSEQRHQNTAFIILLDEPMPETLIKHFRLRKSNRITPQNLAKMSSDVQVDTITPQMLDLSSPESDELLRKILPIDYAILGERLAPGTAPRLSHVHVKIERLTDNAIRELGIDLGYVDRRLFERGEEYADSLEAKFYEYFGFPSNASGRKSAAAMAAQMLGKAGTRFCVMLANQDDCRITLLDDGPMVTQYMLIRLEPEEAARLLRTARAFGAGDAAPYTLVRDEHNAPIVIYRVDFTRSAPARGKRRSDGDRLLRQPWLEIVDEWIVRIPATGQVEAMEADPVPDLPAFLPFAWARPAG